MKSLLCCFLGILILNFFSCNNASSNLEFVGSLPKTISESSGIEVTEKSNTIWTLEDSGNDSKLYALDQLGNLKHTLEITDQTNTDWEDLTSDQDGNLYIGDFGNNDNDRKDLSIYKINAADLSNANIKSSLKITFFYPEQTAFPPKKSKRFFDVESFFIRNNTFYLFTKNRSSKFDGTTTLYSIPNESGYHSAKKIGSFKTGGNFKDDAITSADISQSGEKVALLSSTKVWIFSDFKANDYFNGKVKEIALSSKSQKEGICFVGNDTLLISDEKSKKNGGNLYRMVLSKL